MRPLSRLPKAHLHLHLEQAVRQSTLDEFAAEAGVPSPNMTRFSSFVEFDQVAQAGMRVLRRPEHLQRLVHEMAEDARDQGCLWIEPALWPPLHHDRLGSGDTVLEILGEAAEAATRRTGVGIGFLIAVNRNEPLEQAQEMVDLAIRWAGRAVTSFGLHNDESRFPPEPFTEIFDQARKADLLPAPHGGELAGPDSVRACVEQLGAVRVQHGIRAVEDPALLDLLVARGVCLDVCPTSNLVLEAVADLAAHPLPRLLEAGVRCSLNADNPVMFGCDVLSEYELARRDLGLTDAQLAAVARASLECSAAPADLVARGLREIDAWLAGN